MNNEKDIIIALKNDSANAFDDLFRMYGQRLFLFSRGFLKDPEDAKEIVQNVFVKIWENRANIDEFQSFKSYLFSIAYNSIITEFRKKHREQKLLENIKLSTPGYHQDLEDQLLYDSTKQEIENAIEALPERRKLIFKLSRFEGRSYQEIASELGISVNTVENQISEALKYLRNSIKKDTLVTLLFFYLFLF
jgi:RNA polymerase sigma-70 factor (ECF subfamily)